MSKKQTEKQTVYVVTGEQKVSWVTSPMYEDNPTEIKCSRDLGINGVISNIVDYLREESLERGILSKDGQSIDLDKLCIEECRFGGTPFTGIEEFAPLHEGGKVSLDQFKDLLRRQMEGLSKLETEVYLTTFDLNGFCEIKVCESKM